MEPLFENSEEGSRKQSVRKGLNRLDWLLNQFKQDMSRENIIIEGANESDKVKNLRKKQLSRMQKFFKHLGQATRDLKKADLSEVT